MFPPVEDSPRPDVGDLVLGRYRLERVLGKGGVGIVYFARDERLGRSVAVKVLSAKATTNMRGADNRLIREAKTLAALTHPHLVTLLDYDQLPDGSPAMVMEYIEGQSLKDLSSGHPFTPVEVVTVLHQTLDALAPCHEAGIIHRDLKPANMLVQQKAGSGLHIKLIDFGLAQLIADEGATALTLNGEVFGSPRYMAPEQWLQEEVDPRTDVYALGLVGYRLVTGRHFVDASNPVDAWKMHMSAKRPLLDSTRDGTPLPPALARLIQKAASAERGERYATVAEMCAELEPLLGATTTLAPVEVVAEPKADQLEEIDPAEMTQAVHAVVAGNLDATMTQSSPLDDYDDEEDDDDRTVIEKVPVLTPEPQLVAEDLEAGTEEESLRPEPEAHEPEAHEAEHTLAESGRVMYRGGIATSITKDDFERALAEANSAPPAAIPPEPPPPAAVRAQIQHPQVAGQRAGLLDTATIPAQPPPPHAAPPSRVKLFVIGAVLFLVGAGLAILIAR